VKTKREKELDKGYKSEQAVRAIDESLQHIRGITLRIDAARADADHVSGPEENLAQNVSRASKTKAEIKIDEKIENMKEPFTWFIIVVLVTAGCWLMLQDHQDSDTLFDVIGRGWNYLVGLLMLVSLAFGLGRLSAK
jgi:hypothetical protein